MVSIGRKNTVRTPVRNLPHEARQRLYTGCCGPTTKAVSSVATDTLLLSGDSGARMCMMTPTSSKSYSTTPIVGMDVAGKLVGLMLSSRFTK